MIYLDNNATTAIAPSSLNAMLTCLSSGPVNPSSKHDQGEQAKRQLIEARAQVAQAFGARPAEVVFTSSGTESNHLAIYGALAGHPAGGHIITTTVEHSASLALFEQLEATGYSVTRLPVDAQGRVSAESVIAALRPETILVSIMWVNNETGAIFPLEAIAELLNGRGIILHTDAVQAAGKLAINFANIPLDLVSISGHKLHAPPGVGVLLVRRGRKLRPLINGQQERGLRGGTENLPGIVALGAACSRFSATQMLQEISQISALRDRLELGVQSRVGECWINGRGSTRVANTSNIGFRGIAAEALLDRLGRAGIYASAGAACTSAGSQPSHVLKAMGLSDADALSSVRFSLSRETTVADIDRVLDLIPTIVAEFSAAAA